VCCHLRRLGPCIVMKNLNLSWPKEKLFPIFFFLSSSTRPAEIIIMWCKSWSCRVVSHCFVGASRSSSLLRSNTSSHVLVRGMSSRVERNPHSCMWRKLLLTAALSAGAGFAFQQLPAYAQSRTFPVVQSFLCSSNVTQNLCATR